MGDPLSLTASVSTILDLTSTIVRYVNDVRKASAEQRAFALEANVFCNLLFKLNHRVKQEGLSQDGWHSSIMALGPPNGPLIQFQSTLQEVVDKVVHARKSDKLQSALIWTFVKPEVTRAMNQIVRLTEVINLLMINDLKESMDAIHGKIANLTKTTERINERVQQQHMHQNKVALDMVSRWLSVRDPSVNFNKALRERQVGTGSWLLDNQYYKKWKVTAPSFMWLHGKPGCGKTVLSATIIEDVQQHAKTLEDAVVSYFYFDFNDRSKQSPVSAIRRLLFDFVRQKARHLDAVERLKDKCSDGHGQPTDNEVRTALKEAIAQTTETFLILDALDECTADRANLLAFLQELIQLNPPGLHILVTSRWLKDIVESLVNSAKPHIDIGTDLITQDIEKYVRHRLSQDLRFQGWQPTVKEQIIFELLSKADGMFRWVYCQLEVISKCYKQGALEKALQSLPKTLDETYDRILRIIESDDQLDDALKVLRWLCFSARPVSLSEMVEVIAIDNGNNGSFNPKNRVRQHSDVLAICTSLISYGPVFDDRKQKETVQVRLAHFTVKEYLFSNRCQLHPKFETKICHSFLSQNCLHYLYYACTEIALDDKVIENHPLVRYAAQYWWLHARKLEVPLCPEVLRLAVRFLSKSYIELFTLIERESESEFREMLHHSAQELVQPLYYAVLTELPELIASMINTCEDVNAIGGHHGTALQAVVRYGDQKLTQQLLTRGADPNIIAGETGTALQVAATFGRETIVQQLLRSGADPNIVAGDYGTAIQAASMNARKGIVQLLLDHGAKVDLAGARLDNALQLGAATGKVPFVEMLLEHGADINLCGDDTGTALHAASEEGHEEMVRVLLQKGADANIRNKDNVTPLRQALSRGDNTIVQMLLDAGADPSSDVSTEYPVLYFASKGGKNETVQMVLKLGADINRQTPEGETALYAASLHGRESTVSLLLEKGADMDLQGGEFGSALAAASCRGHQGTVQTLLTSGAKVNDSQSGYCVALEWAAQKGQEEVVQTLIDAGAGVNDSVQGFSPALEYAVQRRHYKVAQMLQDKGAIGKAGSNFI